MFLKGLIMKCSSHIKEERTIGSIYYLLTGKKSIQTIQDAYMYGLDSYYGVFTKLGKLDFDKTIEELVDQQLLTVPSESTSISKPTVKGLKLVKEYEQHSLFSYFNGVIYHKIGLIFQERLFLLIQVLTNSKMKHTSYIPVTDKPRTLQWMKAYYQKIKLQVDEQLADIYHELSSLLSYFPTSESEMFVDRLTGFRHYGLSMHQLAEQYKLTLNDVQILLIGMTHHMLDMIQEDNDKYPLLSELIDDLSTTGFISQSAERTYKLIKKGYSIEDISQVRRLKINTIHDHIVEISLYHSDFPIEAYVSKKKQYEILQAAQQINTSKLKKIKDIVSKEISYFEIRLALTSINKSLK